MSHPRKRQASISTEEMSYSPRKRRHRDQTDHDPRKRPHWDYPSKNDNHCKHHPNPREREIQNKIGGREIPYKPHSPSRPYSVDSVYPSYHESSGHFKYILGESIGARISAESPPRRRYKLLSFVGEGTFGRVFSCWDRLKEDYVAVKVVKAVRKYTDSAKFEIEILEKLQKGTGDGGKVEQHCINLLSSFTFKGHVCMVFPHCGLSLYDFMKQNGYRPFEMYVIKDVAKYLFQSLDFMHNKMKLIHTDLKPENILFKSKETRNKELYNEETSRDSRSQDSPTTSSRSRSSSRKNRTKSLTYKSPLSTKIKVIDLGSAIFENDHHSSIISTRHYRAPEVILRFGWSYPADIWSAGCILLELFTGDTVFQTHHNQEHLYMMESLLGPFPPSFLSRNSDDKKLEKKIICPKNSTVDKYFRRKQENGQVKFEVRYEGKRRIKNIKKLERLVDRHEFSDFYDLLCRTLSYAPEKRITARDALSHPFLSA